MQEPLLEHSGNNANMGLNPLDAAEWPQRRAGQSKSSSAHRDVGRLRFVVPVYQETEMQPALEQALRIVLTCRSIAAPLPHQCLPQVRNDLAAQSQALHTVSVAPSRGRPTFADGEYPKNRRLLHGLIWAP